MQSSRSPSHSGNPISDRKSRSPCRTIHRCTTHSPEHAYKHRCFRHTRRRCTPHCPAHRATFPPDNSKPDHMFLYRCRIGCHCTKRCWERVCKHRSLHCIRRPYKQRHPVDTAKCPLGIPTSDDRIPRHYRTVRRCTQHCWARACTYPLLHRIRLPCRPPHPADTARSPPNTLEQDRTFPRHYRTVRRCTQHCSACACKCRSPHCNHQPCRLPSPVDTATTRPGNPEQDRMFPRRCRTAHHYTPRYWAHACTCPRLRHIRRSCMRRCLPDTAKFRSRIPSWGYRFPFRCRTTHHYKPRRWAHGYTYRWLHHIRQSCNSHYPPGMGWFRPDIRVADRTFPSRCRTGCRYKPHYWARVCTCPWPHHTRRPCKPHYPVGKAAFQLGNPVSDDMSRLRCSKGRRCTTSSWEHACKRP